MSFESLSPARKESVITWYVDFVGFERDEAIRFEKDLDMPDAYDESEFTGDIFNNLIASREIAREEAEKEAEREQYELCRAFAVNDMGICEEEFEDLYELAGF